MRITAWYNLVAVRLPRLHQRQVLVARTTQWADDRFWSVAEIVLIGKYTTNMMRLVRC
jgi:hypothetical protein